MSDRNAQPIGEVIDGLGCATALREGDLAAAAVVIMKVIEPDGSVRLAVTWSDGMSWIERLGMLRAAEHMDLPSDEQLRPLDD